jgi:C4-dicarboxylate-binding protein DctP
MTNHGYIGYVVVVNKKFWDGLPPDIRGELSKAMAEATEFGTNKSQQENADALAEIKKAGKTQILIPTADETAQMRKAMEPIYADMAARVGKGLIDEVLKTTAGVSN